MRIAGAGIFFIASPVFAAALTLMGTSTPGTPGIQATYLTKDGLLNINDVYFTSTNTTGALASDFSSVQWTGNFGNLHAIGQTSLAGDDLIKASYANLAVTWTDFILLTPTVASPAPIQVKLSVNLHGSLSTNFDPSLQEATAFGGAGMDDAVALANQIAQEMCSDPTNFCGPNISDDSGLNVSFALADVTNCAAGCYVGLTGWLEVFTRAVHIGGNTAASHSADAMANFLNTAGFHIDVLTPGWTATSLSGTDYSTASSEPAPEPADAVLSAFGLGLMGLVSRRKRFSKA